MSFNVSAYTNLAMKMTTFSFFVTGWSSGEGFMHSLASSFWVGDWSTKMKNMTSFHQVGGHMLTHLSSCFQCPPCISQVEHKYCASPSRQNVGLVTQLQIWNLTFSANVNLYFFCSKWQVDSPIDSVLAQTCSAQQQGSLLGIVKYCLSNRLPTTFGNMILWCTRLSWNTLW